MTMCCIVYVSEFANPNPLPQGRLQPLNDRRDDEIEDIKRGISRQSRDNMHYVQVKT